MARNFRQPALASCLGWNSVSTSLRGAGGEQNTSALQLPARVDHAQRGPVGELDLKATVEAEHIIKRATFYLQTGKIVCVCLRQPRRWRDRLDSAVGRVDLLAQFARRRSMCT